MFSHSNSKEGHTMDAPQQVGTMENFGAQLKHEKETFSLISGVFVEEAA